MNWKIMSAYVAGAAVLVLLLTNGGKRHQISAQAKQRPEVQRPEATSLFPNPGLSFDAAFHLTGTSGMREEEKPADIHVFNARLLPATAINEPLSQSDASTDFGGLWMDESMDETFDHPSQLFSTADSEFNAHRPVTESSTFRYLSEAGADHRPLFSKSSPQSFK